MIVSAVQLTPKTTQSQQEIDNWGALKSAYCTGILQVRLRIPFLSMNEIRQFNRVSDKECRLGGHLARISFTGTQIRTRLKNNQSRFPSSVYNLKANPRPSLTLSAEPFSPATVENLVKSLVFLPTVFRKAALVKLVMSWVTSNSPYAPAPLA